MYCVIEMYGDYEPWWFLDGWEEDIVAKKQFDDYYEALKYYKKPLAANGRPVTFV